MLRSWIVLGLWCSCSWGAPSANVNSQGVMLDGYDAVSYFENGKPTRGNAKFKAQVADRTYWFASAEHAAEFQKNVKKYEPQFEGWCAYAVADSASKVAVNPEKFLIQDGRLLLFYDGFWGDTREKWSHTPTKNPAAFLKQADVNWPQAARSQP